MSRRYYTPLTDLYRMPLIDFMAEVASATKEAQEERRWQARNRKS